MPQDVCIQIIKNRRRKRTVGEFFRVWEIGNEPAKGQFPLRLVGTKPKVYESVEDISQSTTFDWIVVTGVPTTGLNKIKRLAESLDKDVEVVEEGGAGKTTIVREADKMSRAHVNYDDFPAPRKAELNQNNITTMAWGTFSGAARVRLPGDTDRPITDNDVDDSV